MKILVTGANGQLGHDILLNLEARGIDGIPSDITEFDITQAAETEQFILDHQPNAVIHCAAYTAVDKAEDDIERCQLINVTGTENIARACQRINAKLVYVSTDYVFPGIGDTPYEINAPTGPLSIYGQTKLAGELAVQNALSRYFIVRTSWVFGKNGNNFVKTMLRLGKEREAVNVVCDQVGSPTYTVDLAKLLVDMALSEKYGVYHATNEGFCSWAEFATEIFHKAGLSTHVNYVTTDQYPARAHRPSNSRLSKARLTQAGFEKLPAWEDALSRYFVELKSKM
ncbi:MAG TPA: dTDP-4-dehydrorhamnose reductase [Clostridia bacterium]|nr:dTDP-4-dehydrorhamnose reductase [Clostridia bacterium]